MSTASPSVSGTAAPQYNANSVHAGQAHASHSNGPAMHNHSASALGGSDPPVAQAPGAGLYQEGVAQAPHHLAGSFPGAQMSPMTSYAAYSAAQHPMYGASYSGHAYTPYPNYLGHISHYGHPHYPGTAATPAYHAPMMGGMVSHGGYTPHSTGHIPSHHAQAAIPIAMAGTTSGSAPATPSMTSGAMMPTSYGATPQYNVPVPLGGRHRVTTTLWEDEGTLCFQVDVKGVCVARRHDNNMVNGTKLLNVCGMSRGKRDGILKNEKERIVVKVGAMHLKGVWIAFNRGKQLAEQHGIADALYPLFEPNIQSFLYHPDNYPRTAAVMAAAQERQVHRHYNMSTSSSTPVKDMNGADMGTSLPIHSGIPNNHWANSQQAAHEAPAANNASEASLHYQYPAHAHYQHQASAMPTAPQQGGQPNAFSPSTAHYSPQGMQPPMRSGVNSGFVMDRRLDQTPETGSSQTATSSSNLQQTPSDAGHRRVSSLKRSSAEQETSSSVVSPQQGPVENSTQSSTEATPAGVSTASLPSESFSLDEKRPKGEDTSSQQGLNMIYSSEDRPREPEAQNQGSQE
ncbi:hypothetical protein MEQU1_001627 [Malassezia equina]|uniref:HTH APSES-type domain-containing protein n=1 Tax=Malassezia equina TaxID=1381935 RepID=A0AAF0EE34_9BASI|nr:hypothetical protein MEQU1_001627 [Malassezia equina]